MRIFHAVQALSNGAYNSYTFCCFSSAFDTCQGYGTKTITLFCDWRYNRSQSQFSKSEEYC
ncbi:hypothetical protein CJP72_17140 [Citrobacter sp. NCU1]|nr:hypothetical protein [Citrobacter sp. NCU1]